MNSPPQNGPSGPNPLPVELGIRQAELPAPVSDQVQPPSAGLSALDSEPANAVTDILRQPRGKIARLPKATRDKLNFMLRDGLQHAEALARLGDEAKDITPKNVSNWHLSPALQHWLLQQDWLEDLRSEQESAFDLLNDFDAPKFNEAALQLAITRLFLALRHIDSGDINQKLGGNARTFAGLVHSLARACRETTHIEQYRDACAKAVAAELKQLNMDRELSDNEYQLLVDKMDRVFKVPRRRPPAPLPAAPSNGSK